MHSAQVRTSYIWSRHARCIVMSLMPAYSGLSFVLITLALSALRSLPMQFIDFSQMFTALIIRLIWLSGSLALWLPACLYIYYVWLPGIVSAWVLSGFVCLSSLLSVCLCDCLIAWLSVWFWVCPFGFVYVCISGVCSIVCSALCLPVCKLVCM